MSEWISVENGTPVVDGSYLVHLAGPIRGGELIHCAIRHKEEWFTVGGCFGFDVPSVTHWQPLPAPPK